MISFTRVGMSMDFFQESIVGQEIEIGHRLEGFECCLLALPVAMQGLLVCQTTGERTCSTRTTGTSVLHWILLTNETLLRLHRQDKRRRRRMYSFEFEHWLSRLFTSVQNAFAYMSESSLLSSVQSEFNSRIDVDTDIQEQRHLFARLDSSQKDCLVLSSIPLTVRGDDVSPSSIRPSSIDQETSGFPRRSNVPLRCLSSL